jgi:hypothetical protein
MLRETPRVGRTTSVSSSRSTESSPQHGPLSVTLQLIAAALTNCRASRFWAASHARIPAQPDISRFASNNFDRSRASTCLVVLMSFGKAGPFLTAAAMVACTATAQAHAGPQVRGIYLGQTSNMLLSNRGLLFGEPGSQDWSLLCNEALGISTSEVPKVVVLPDGRIMAASSRGLTQTTDGGCHWEGVATFEKVHSPSLIQDPNNPQRLYLSTFAPGMSALHVSDDGGLTWQQLLAADDSEYLGYIHVAPNQPERLYLRTLTVGTESFSYATWRSDDAGKSWEKSPVTLAESENDLQLLAVSPSDPQFLVAKAEAGMQMVDAERLLVSHDAGKTFDSPISLQVINAVSFSADGATVSVGSDDGLFVSSDAGKTFSRVGDAAYIDSLYLDGDALMVGGFFHGVEAGVHGVGISSDGGATMTPWMLLNQVVHPLACDSTAMAAITCKDLWPDWEREILGTDDEPSATNAGSTASGAGTAGTAGMSPSAGGASAAVGGRGTRDMPPAATSRKRASSCSFQAPSSAPHGTSCVSLLAALACAWLLRRRSSP